MATCCWLPQTYVRAFPVWTALFFRNVLLSIEQKAIGASTLMETEVFVWIFFCMNTDAYHPNGPIWLDYRFCYRPLLCGT